MKKLNADGRLIWVREYSGDERAWLTGIAEADNGAIAVVGWVSGQMVLGGHTLTTTTRTSDGFIATFDADGYPLGLHHVAGPYRHSVDGVIGQRGGDFLACGTISPGDDDPGGTSLRARMWWVSGVTGQAAEYLADETVDTGYCHALAEVRFGDGPTELVMVGDV
ncbi:MAG: hypothetical protein GY704_06205, partial [Phycisphaeraceae bacterium]|nr:hypothetical protein [Phycisphaeraceae bacterium]